MADNISNDDYQVLCSRFPLLQKISHRGFGTKVWLVFRALNFGSVSVESVASNPCQSLMENEIAFSLIGRYLEELSTSKILRTDVKGYVLLPENAYELHRICYEMGKKITESGTPLDAIIRECGYTWDKRNRDLANNFANGDVNAKADTLKDLLSQLAFAGARFLVKVVVKLEEKVE